jgi:hypothetical protein
MWHHRKNFPKKDLEGKGICAHTHTQRQTDRQTDIAILWGDKEKQARRKDLCSLGTRHHGLGAHKMLLIVFAALRL